MNVGVLSLVGPAGPLPMVVSAPRPSVSISIDHPPSVPLMPATKSWT